MHRSAVRFLYSRELKLGTAELLQRHPVPGNFHLVNCRCEWRFDFDSVFWSPNLYLPRTSPTKTAPFAENSHRIASDPPIRRHLPTTVEFPQPAIANTKAIAIIRNRGLD